MYMVVYDVYIYTVHIQAYTPGDKYVVFIVHAEYVATYVDASVLLENILCVQLL